ncbi:hypothetical protein MesoLj131a_66560 (plasmid) [Mesorhizobium sp. 131-2-1]|nr:hypothetical protein MesoLj131a_66560 [Mesorhizobium sp. 131-2-1]
MQEDGAFFMGEPCDANVLEARGWHDRVEIREPGPSWREAWRQRREGRVLTGLEVRGEAPGRPSWRT